MSSLSGGQCRIAPPAVSGASLNRRLEHRSEKVIVEVLDRELGPAARPPCPLMLRSRRSRQQAVRSEVRMTRCCAVVALLWLLSAPGVSAQDERSRWGVGLTFSPQTKVPQFADRLKFREQEPTICCALWR